MKALVTGANGFLGRHVARTLGACGYTVTGIGHGNWSDDECSNFKVAFWHSADVTLNSLIVYAGEPDVIVHCAGSGSVGFSVVHPFEDYQRTVSTTAAVLEYMRLYSPGSRLIYPSSAAVYGVADSLPIAESAPVRPASPYGVHKSIAEQLCRSYAETFRLRISAVRFFSIYGEGLRKQLLWDACNKISTGDFVFAGSGNERRDWIHVVDAANLILAACECASSDVPVINGGSGEGVTVREVLEHVFICLGVRQAPRFNGVPRAGDPPGYAANIERAKSRGWSPRCAWQDGLAAYVKWFVGQKS